MPYYHVGDAGLHYPRAGIDASSEPPPWWAKRGPIGPFPVPEPEIPIPQGIADILEYSGVGGEWFDSNDVVEHLRSKGLQLDINSSIFEIQDVDEAVSQASFFNSQGMGSIENNSGFSSTTTDSLFADASLPQDPNPWSQVSSFMPKGLSMNIDTGFLETSALGDIHLDLAMFPGLMSPPPTLPMRKKKFLDVENFVKSEYLQALLCLRLLRFSIALAQTTTCLGRTICFRRVAVDSALEKATIEMHDDGFYLG